MKSVLYQLPRFSASVINGDISWRSLRFSSAGGLRTTAKRERVPIETVGSDPEGHHLTEDHYSSPNRTVNGTVYKYRETPSTAVEHCFSLASSNLVRLMTRFGSEFAGTSPEEREELLWCCIAYIYLRHLHLFVPRYALSNLVKNLPNIDIGHNHVDAAGSICGIVSCDGMNVVPAHLASRLPSIGQGHTLHTEEEHHTRHRPLQRYKVLRESIVRGFWDVLPKYVALRQGKSLKGMDMNDFWAVGSKAKSLERLLYLFRGDKDDDFPEFRAYLVYTRETGDNLWKASSTEYSDALHLTTFIKNNWVALTTCYPELCFNPPIPKLGTPGTSQQSPSRSNSKPKVSRLNKAYLEGVELPTSSFKLDSFNILSDYISGINGFVKIPFSAIGGRLRNRGRTSL